MQVYVKKTPTIDGDYIYTVMAQTANQGHVIIQDLIMEPGEAKKMAAVAKLACGVLANEISLTRIELVKEMQESE